jgi:hypothetical protein
MSTPYGTREEVYMTNKKFDEFGLPIVEQNAPPMPPVKPAKQSTTASKQEIDEQIKSLRNTAEFLWDEGWYAKSMRLSEAAELFEKYSAMFNVVDSACLTVGFDFDLDNPAKSLQELIYREIVLNEDLDESIESESLEIPDTDKTEQDFVDWVDDLDAKKISINNNEAV